MEIFTFLHTQYKNHDFILYASIFQVRIKEIYTFKMIQKTNEAYSELHSHTSQEKNSHSFVSNNLDECWCCALLLDAITSENGYLTIEDLVCLTVREERFCNSCATCILHTISHGTIQLSETVCDIYTLHSRYRFFPHSAGHINSCVVG
jgi:hypothetical protein